MQTQICIYNLLAKSRIKFPVLAKYFFETGWFANKCGRGFIVFFKYIFISSLVIQSCFGHLIWGICIQRLLGVHPPNYALGLVLSGIIWCLFLPDPSDTSPFLPCPLSGHQMQSLFFGSFLFVSFPLFSGPKTDFLHCIVWIPASCQL